MSQKRKDKRGRLLNNGETQDPVTGEYRFSYYVDGKRKNFRSWRLNPTDPTPTGKRKGKSLREKIAKYEKEKEKQLDHEDGNMTVYELAEKYISQRQNVKNTTRNNYKTVLNFLKTEEFSKKKRISTASSRILKRENTDSREESSRWKKSTERSTLISRNK